jgi:hypothetical protein
LLLALVGMGKRSRCQAARRSRVFDVKTAFGHVLLPQFPETPRALRRPGPGQTRGKARGFYGRNAGMGPRRLDDVINPQEGSCTWLS